MQYDLPSIADLCEAFGFAIAHRDATSLSITVSTDVRLLFCNDDADDCLIGFVGTPWHAHGDIVLASRQASIELSAVDVVAGLADGQVLICEGWSAGQLQDRWLVHRDVFDGQRLLEPDAELRLRRAVSNIDISSAC